MNSYLDLVKEYAEKHKRKNRMSLFVILLAVALVATIFGMADMELQTQQISMKKQYGSWHIGIKDMAKEQEQIVALRPQIAVSGYLESVGSRSGYTLFGKAANILGVDEALAKELGIRLEAGTWPDKGNEALITGTMARTFGIEPGDSITLERPDGDDMQLLITAVAGDTASILKADQAGILMSAETLRRLFSPEEYSSAYYIKFRPFTNIQAEKLKIAESLGITPDSIGENAYLLAAMGQSDDPFFVGIYGTAAVLFLFVLTAAVLMITSSFQTSVTDRIRFFGMLRCLGATRKQVKRFVIKEGMRYCRKAIPAGLAVGVLVIWMLCGFLRVMNPEYFSDIPLFGISIPALAAGAAVGLAACLLASLSPAKKASSVSPLTAVSGNARLPGQMKNMRFFRAGKVDRNLGIYHALENRKNLLLMTVSFALSILMFMSFSGIVDFMHHAVRPLRPWSPDLSLVSADNTCSIENKIYEELEKNPEINKVYGRMFAFDVPFSGEQSETQEMSYLVSYEEHQFGWAEDFLQEGSIEEVRGTPGKVLAVAGEGRDWHTGERLELELNGELRQVQIAGVLGSSPFDSENGESIFICSEDSFRQLTGENAFTILDIQLKRGASEEMVTQLREQAAGLGLTFSDARQSKAESQAVMISFSVFVYGFLAVILMIAVLHIINSINMSVTSRMNQCGVMRAIGMEGGQLLRMVRAEAVVYAALGSILGIAMGIPAHHFVFKMMVTSHWGTAWQVPFLQLAVVVGVTVAATLLAVRGPARKIRDMDIVDTIHAL